MEPFLSIIICTYNPKRDYLDKALKALEAQTLLIEKWELLLIDNASDLLLAEEIDLSWHPQARHIREEELGLTPARLRGIKEALGEILVFVDDDNVLEPDYLEAALKISKDYPMIGAWGGEVRAEFEEVPPDWTKPYWWMLAIRELERDSWSNLLVSYATVPVGAGMCIRKVVAKKYAELAISNSKRLELDAKGKQLLRSGDIDMAFTSCDLGLGTGLFVSLKLNHLIPVNRLQEEYLLRLAEGIGYSNTFVEYYRGKIPTLPPFSGLITLLKYLYFKRGRFESKSWRIFNSVAKGKHLATREIFNT